MNYVRTFVCGLTWLGLTSMAIAQATDSDDGRIVWLRSASEAAELARETGKPILVYARSENCYYCDLLQKKTWQDPRIAAQINRDMIPLKLTLEENKEAIEAMKIKGFPSTIVFSADRQYVARIDGYVTAGEFMSRMAKVRLTLAQQSPVTVVR
ncbi:MAG: thioredoxin family protein [Pirellulaceae bacterium]|nr:thioredoxin family protein [Pirellulaceae bacterium]